ncbi:MAG: UDP-N-acetylglucosamine 1-carboxyvinyltransferase [Planctomycetia bacterium]|jgi:UDP-N-acetylglucosamine 1-carboxyvinyltransferase
MAHYTIEGGYSLRGSVVASGAKNATLPMMAAAILAEEPIVLDRTPRLADVATMAELLRQLGVEVEEKETLTLKTVDERPVRADYELLQKMRAGFCVLGPLLVRRGRAEVAMPGGCSIGDRPVDLHLAGLEKLGAKISIEHGYVVASAKRLIGATLDMTGPHGPSVTGTIHLLSTATLAEGQTTITRAAVEPEVTEVAQMLVRMGAKITGIGGPTLCVEGVECLHGVRQRVIFDRIEAATLLFAAAIAGGSVTVCDVVPAMLAEPLAMLRQSGCTVVVEEDRVSVSREEGPLRPLDLRAEPYPGMPTDLQAQWMALMTQAAGSSTIDDRIFPGRFMHVAELRRLGAKVEHIDGPATVHGPVRLEGADVRATDLRAGAALVLAGLAAEGVTRVFGLEHLDRGYDRLDEKLASLGAKIRRE